MINWKVRFKNKSFLIVFVPAVFLLVQLLLQPFGVDITIYKDWVMSTFNAALSVLMLLGVVIDPTTTGVSDSEQALTYEQPRSDVEGDE